MLRPVTPPIVQLADRIEGDIRERGLQPGDSYLNTAETAKMLKVGTASANRALQLLEQRQVLVRSQRRGTFVTAPVTVKPATRRINVIVDEAALKMEGVLADGLLVGIQSAMPHAQLRFRFTPTTDDAEFIEGLIHEALQSSQREGFVLVRSSLTVQRLVANSGLPAVIHGTAHPSIQGIPCVERDTAQAARILVDFLAEAGCRQLILLLRQHVMPGDHILLDQVQHSLADRDLSGRLTVRCLPPDLEVVRHEVASVLKHARDKIGVICRSEPLAEGAQAAVDVRSVRARGGAPVIVMSDYYRSGPAVARWAYSRLIQSPEEIGRQIGHLLLDQYADRPPVSQRVILPVKLVVPDA
ncbi:Bacterial regulatory protein, gntR family [Caulifigura coniformis]|uniref:Bacterial regulatory protein, gntR family n=1 Tax=Caulifigura coniformis TaxID=2527983 RepID=A0A517SG89_9PLAN|nr:GntR family transcriptional regulator [Caulifigura coniformis]QDT55139.1 Bacterial regulatory protein, gntR family [Caulifigura coniformis]